SVWASTKPGKLELGFVWPNRWLRSADNARQRAAAMPSMSGAFDDDVSGLRAQSAADHFANKRGRDVLRQVHECSEVQKGGANLRGRAPGPGRIPWRRRRDGDNGTIPASCARRSSVLRSCGLRPFHHGMEDDNGTRTTA